MRRHREHAVDPLARVVPERQPNLSALPVVLGERMLVEPPVLLGRPEQEPDLLGVEHRIHQQEAGALVLGKLFGRKRTVTHGRGSVVNDQMFHRQTRR